MINVQTAKTAELIAFYNENAESPVKKFTNRATAERRVQSLIDNMEPEMEAEQNHEAVYCPACNIDVIDNGYDVDDKTGATTCLGCGHTWGGEAVEVDANRSEAQRKAWANPEVKAARSKRYKVDVDGEEYGSVAKAFTALNLDLKDHVKFRGQLRDAGELDAFGYRWKIVEKV